MIRCASLSISLILTTLVSLTAFPAHAEETAVKKLVVTKAVYGDLPNGAKTNVTEKVAAMVKNNTLTVEATNDNFDDPAEGVGKKLQVDYTLDGVARSKIVDENETLTIKQPKQPAAGSKLIIVKAVYGDLPNGAKSDVTDKVDDMVKDNALSVAASNDNFGDPAFTIGKKLQIDYILNGVAKTKMT